MSELMRQWNSGCFSVIVQFFDFATAAWLLQFFIRAAMSHSSFDVGQDVTILTSLTASWQPSLTLNGNCCKKFKTNILILGFFSINNDYKVHYFFCTTTKYKSIQITWNWIISIASVDDKWNQVTMLQP